MLSIQGEACEGRLGFPGSCKTLDQTEQIALPFLLDGAELYCSYWLNWNRPNYHYFHPEDFDAVRYVRNCVVMFDEIAQTFDPRHYEAEDSGVRSWFQLHRHRHVSIYFNTQDVSLVAKTVGIVADSWFYLTNANDGPFISWLRKNFGLSSRVCCFSEELTLNDLKRMVSGFERPIVYVNGDEFDDDNSDQGDLPPEPVKVKYLIKNILHYELNDYKVEYFHKFCPDCLSRQGSQILKENTLKEIRVDSVTAKKYGLKIPSRDMLLKKSVLRVPEYCPKHKKVLLEVRESAMYDTNYEPPVKERSVVFKPFIDSPKGYRQIEYRGQLTDAQLHFKRDLEVNLPPRGSTGESR